MIKHIKGDAVELLKLGLVDGLVHCCNAQGVMGAGIAAQIKKEFPATYEYYNKCVNDNIKTYDGDSSRLLGDIYPCVGVINLIGQVQTGTHKRQVNYGAIAVGLQRIVGFINSSHTKYSRERPYKLALPKGMGCGLAGGDWDKLTVYIVDFQQ